MNGIKSGKYVATRRPNEKYTINFTDKFPF